MHKRTAALLIAAFMLCSSLASWPQIARASQAVRNPLSVRPIDRLVRSIDERQVVTLSGSRHPMARPENSIGAVRQDRPMDRMVLVLRPDAVQEKALKELVRAQQDPGSPYYHEWLTPQSFGKRFGVSQNDLTQIVNWLHRHGLQVSELSASRRSVVFSGSVGQVQSAFHTSIRSYRVEGESHYANATDPQIPRALAEVVRGVYSLHDFRSAPQVVASAPAYTAGNGAHFLSPQDWDTIYNVSPLFSQGLDGTGQSIAVLGRVDVALQDVRTFRSNSGLPPNDPQMIVNGPDPGFPDCNDEAESALDVEWAGAIAKNATVKFVTSKSGATDGINLSALYAVNNNVAPIVSLSYGLCEAAYSPAGNAFWDGLWAQAASQGMSVFVSSGDSGAAGCDSPSLKTATHGRGVNALCSSPYSTCVGGTQFNDVYTPGQYWSASNASGMSSALSYIPEVAWNESGWSGGLWSTGGGASRVYSKPAWQSALGVPADGMRDVPDVSMNGAIHDAYITQIQGSIFYVSGTSAATPSLASVMALVLENEGTLQGNINPTLYSLANLQFSNTGATVFHDITSGSNSVPGVVGFNAGTGYDLATGLGSVDATLLVNHWSDGSTANFILTPSSSSISVAVGSSNTVGITETALSGFNAPVSLSASGAPAGVTVTLSSSTLANAGSSTVTVAAAPNTAAGNYTVTTTGTGGGLTRTATFALSVVVVPSMTLTPSAAAVTLSTGLTAPVTLTSKAVNGFNSAVAFSVTGLPKGVTAKFSPTGIAAPGNGSSTLTLAAAVGTVAGSYNLTVTGTGGGITQTSPVGLTVVVPGFTLTPSAASATLNAGSPTTLTLTTAAFNGFNSAVAFSVSGLPKGVTAKFSPTGIAAPGNGSSTLTLAQTTGAISGTYNLTVAGVGGGVTTTQPISLTMIVPGFTLTPSAASASVVVGTPATITLTTAAFNGFNSDVAFSVSGVPKGITASLSPAKALAPGNGSSTLTLTETTGAVAGTYKLIAAGVGGAVVTTQTINLTVVVPSITLTPSAASASIMVGAPAIITLTTAVFNGFSSDVAFAVSGLPKGVTASFSPAKVLSPGNGGSTLTLTLTTGATSGIYKLLVAAGGTAAATTQTLSLTVVAPSITMTASAASASIMVGAPATITLSTAVFNGFNSDVAFAVSGLPKGVTASFSPAKLLAPGIGSSDLTLTETTGAVPGTYKVIMAAGGGGVAAAQTLSLTVVVPSITMTASAASTSVMVGAPATITLSTAVFNGFNSDVAFSVSGLPKGITASFSPAKVLAPGNGSSILTLALTTGAASGTYKLTVIAAGVAAAIQPVSLTVVAPAFTLTLGGASVVLKQGGAVPITMTTAGMNGFNSAVTLVAGTLPKGVTASFAPAGMAAPGTGTSALTLTAASDAAVGTYNLILGGTGGGVSQVQRLMLTVTR